MHYETAQEERAMNRRHKRIEHWDDERSIGNSLIVTLLPGLRFEEDGEHVRGFDTVKDAMRDVRTATRCGCEMCQQAAAA
jgi:hypothetical protein